MKYEYAHLFSAQAPDAKPGDPAYWWLDTDEEGTAKQEQFAVLAVALTAAGRRGYVLEPIQPGPYAPWAGFLMRRVADSSTSPFRD